VARNAALDTMREPLTATSERPVVLASEQAHVSVRKAAMVLGLGEDGVVPIATDPDYRMDPEDLEATIRRLRRQGARPFCVVATAGTTGTGSIDPLPEVAEIAHQGGLWLHVDAAYGGALQFSDRHRSRLAGIERADSLVFNPHKWFFVARNCSMVLFRDGELLHRQFRTALPYMRADAELTNVGEISLHGTQHADVLKLWLSLLLFGREGHEAAIGRGFEVTRSLLAAIAERPHLELAARPDTNIVCFRPRPAGAGDAEADELVPRIQQAVLDEASVYLSVQPLRRGRWLRAVPLHPWSGEEEVERMMAVIDRYRGHQAGH
jgi:glutamate/tyrosine decarboxylase-like PLP-dependent enzyme